LNSKQGIPLKIGLTGGIGSGKSLVLDILKAKGMPILQTDILGHRLLLDKRFLKPLLACFGKGILAKGGHIDRKKLGRLVFKDPRKKNQLNQLMHPKIRKMVANWVKDQSRKARPPVFVVVEVPLLFEKGFYRWFDRSLCVSSPLGLRRKRLLKRGWSLSEIRRREKSQWPQRKKDQKADWVIFNQGTPKELKYAVDQWLDKIKSFKK